MERYTLDAEQFSLQLFLRLTRSKRLIPSRVSLRVKIDEHFSTLEKAGIESLGQLLRALGNKSKITEMALLTGIPEAYLVLLNREAGSYFSRPIPLDFPGIPLEYSEVLRSKGIRNTRDFFEEVQTMEQVKQVSLSTGIPENRLKEISCLCDLSRITGVGPVYARIIYHAGIRSVRDFATTDAATHNELYMKVLEKHNYPLIDLGKDDIQYCIDYASLLLELNTYSKQS